MVSIREGVEADIFCLQVWPDSLQSGSMGLMFAHKFYVYKLKISGRKLASTLILLPFKEFDLIVGMDWLCKYQHYRKIACYRQTKFTGNHGNPSKNNVFGGFLVKVHSTNDQDVHQPSNTDLSENIVIANLLEDIFNEVSVVSRRPVSGAQARAVSKIRLSSLSLVLLFFYEPWISINCFAKNVDVDVDVDDDKVRLTWNLV
ncbi:hypothetical protein IEQ34_016999 [Dendrobium chrysotoxum]|uniref:Uncharacterized protein n=1 Tax=Dendrobium chrysotoxum TaxID=161865 RepID=A0AAV7GH37_DENCH|nr:hypothetical protein IEQ34_016999 [Dendrobium chrysotoxum]